MINNKFIGIVTDVIDEHCFMFRSDNNVNCQIQQIVGVNISDNIYMLASIAKIDVDYFLTNAGEYFTSIASENKLIDLSIGTRSPKYSHRVKATYIGIFEYDETNRHFIESNFSINTYTPEIFQKVISFNFYCIETIYGIMHNPSKYFHVGKFLYPNYSNNGKEFPDVNISVDTFNSHTLISGVTGSGKSRLAALIANQIASNGGHITIIDPHNEYTHLAITENMKTYLFSQNAHTLITRKDIICRNLSFTNKYLTPLVISKLLPNLSAQQIDYIYDVFLNITTDKNYDAKKITLKKVIDANVQKFNSDYIKEGNPEDKLLQAQQYAKEDQKDYLTFIKRYIFYLNKEWNTGKYKVGKAEVAFTVLKRLAGVLEDNIFPDNSNYPIPSWLDFDNRSSINIINIDYVMSDNIRRFVDTIIQCFLTPPTEETKYYRTLIVDEAHLLLGEKSNTSSLLSRLLRESRKFGLSVIFITQNGEDVPIEIKSQFQNKFKFREENSDNNLQFLNNQTCISSLYKGKLMFPMRVDNIERNTNKVNTITI